MSLFDWLGKVFRRVSAMTAKWDDRCSAHAVSICDAVKPQLVEAGYKAFPDPGFHRTLIFGYIYQEALFREGAERGAGYVFLCTLGASLMLSRKGTTRKALEDELAALAPYDENPAFVEGQKCASRDRQRVTVTPSALLEKLKSVPRVT